MSTNSESNSEQNEALENDENCFTVKELVSILRESGKYLLN